MRNPWGWTPSCHSSHLLSPASLCHCEILERHLAAAPNRILSSTHSQLAGVSLTVPLLKEMLRNPRCIGVKNSSMPTQDIQMWRDEALSSSTPR